MTRSDGGRANGASPGRLCPSAGSAIGEAGAGEATANSTEFGSTGAGGGAVSLGSAGFGAGDWHAQPRQPQSSAFAAACGSADSQQEVLAQHEPAPQQETGAFVSTGSGAGTGNGHRHDLPYAGAAPIAVETASRTQSTGW